MAKNKIQHMTVDGKVHTRLSTRTYSHVIVADLDTPCIIANKVVGPGPCVVGYSNTGKVPADMARRWPSSRLEAVNNGTRGEVEGSYVATSSGEGPAA